MLGLFLSGCDPKPSQKEILSELRLDSLLKGNHVDRVDFIDPYNKTNSATGKDAWEIILSLTKTNRIAGSDWEKSMFQRVNLYDGTNLVSSLILTDNNFWQFEDYSFKLKN